MRRRTMTPTQGKGSYSVGHESSTATDKKFLHPQIPPTDDTVKEINSVASSIISQEPFEIPAAPPAPMPESAMVNKIKADIVKIKANIKNKEARGEKVQTLNEQIISKAQKLQERRYQHYDNFGNIIQNIKEIKEEKKVDFEPQKTEKNDAQKGIKKIFELQKKWQMKPSDDSKKAFATSVNTSTATHNRKEELKKIEAEAEKAASAKIVKKRKKMIADELKADKMDVENSKIQKRSHPS